MLRKKIITIYKVLLSVLVPLIFLGCQRDDICPASVKATPSLQISFFDFEDPATPKPPVNLRVKAVDQPTPLLNRANTAEIDLPLRTDVNRTTYELTINAPANPEEEGGNTDTILFTYAREEVYINRACSFKVNFIDLAAILQDDQNSWIRNIIVEEDNIQDETITHIRIFH